MIDVGSATEASQFTNRITPSVRGWVSGWVRVGVGVCMCVFSLYVNILEHVLYSARGPSKEHVLYMHIYSSRVTPTDYTVTQTT
jgi:hypothetical protein